MTKVYLPSFGDCARSRWLSVVFGIPYVLQHAAHRTLNNVQCVDTVLVTLWHAFSADRYHRLLTYWSQVTTSFNYC